MKKLVLLSFILLLLNCFAINANSHNEINIIDFGALGDGSTLNTIAIKKAIDQCAENGGGYIIIPAGEFLTGTIELKSNVYLKFNPGATLLASTDPDDYRKVFPGDNINMDIWDSPSNKDQYLIYAKDAKNTGILGKGIIDAQGEAFYNTEKTRKTGKYKPDGVEYTLKSWRPGPTIAFFSCTQVRLEDFTLLNNPMFGIMLNLCSYVRILNLRIDTNKGFFNGDGMNIKSSDNITISQCHIDSEDDAIFFSTNYWWDIGDRSGNCTAVTVSDCIFSSSCCGIRIGYSGSSSISNMTFSNIIIKKAKKAIDFICNGSTEYDKNKENAFTGSSIKNLIFNNIIAEDVITGITANIQPDSKTPACIENIIFSGLQLNCKKGNYLKGSEKIKISNITFRDSEFIISGQSPENVNELPNSFPIFGGGQFPYGFVLSNTENIRFYNSNITFTSSASGWKSAIYIENSLNINDKELYVVKESACEEDKIIKD